MPDFFKNFFKSSHGSSFRTDIAGIRGIAVMLVALCHFEIPGFGGGFIGPDIFFVLSGYLITGLLVKEYSKNISKRTGRGKISLGAFYLRRTRRILPASLFVLLCINIYARLNMNVLQVAQIKADSIWTVLFGANISFLRQATDYFAQGNAVSPLQHYWSLSVEEQFYFVWPVLFLTAASFHKLSFRGREFDWHQRLRAVFIALGIGSFAWMLVEFTTSPTTAYFSTFSRAWELALGGALSLLSVERIAAKLGRAWTILRSVALAAMVGSIAVVTPTNFGYTLVIPAVATGFLLISGPQSKGDPVHRLLSTKPLTALGAISFSMYLWHWPVFVFGRNLDLMDTLTQRVVGVFVCILLGTLSYWLVERTFLKIPLPKLKPRPNYNGRAGLATSRLFTTSVTVLVVAGLGLVTYPSSSASESTKIAAWVPPASAASYAPGSGMPNGVANMAGQDPVTQAPTTDVVAELGAGEPGVSLSAWKVLVKQSVLNSTKPGTARQIQEFEANVDVNNQSVMPHAGWDAQYVDNQGTAHYGSKTASHRWVMIGDSHTNMMRLSLEYAVENVPDLQIDYYFVPGCRNTLDPKGLRSIDDVYTSEVNQACLNMHKKVLGLIPRLKPDLVILSTVEAIHTVYEEQGTAAFILKLKSPSTKVVILGVSPKFPVVKECLNRTLSNKASCVGNYQLLLRENRIWQAFATQRKFVFVDTANWYCAMFTCPIFVGDTQVTYDFGHITNSFARALGPVFVEAMQDRLN